MEIFLLVALAVVAIVAGYLISQKNASIEALNAELKKIHNADDYVTAQKAKGALYFSEKTREGDKIRSDADAYAATRKADADKAYNDAKRETKLLEAKCTQIKKELAILELDSMVGMVSIDPYEGLKSDEVKNQLALLRGRQDELVKSGAALRIDNYTAKKSALNYQKKQILRCFNAECKSLIDGVTVKNVDTVRAKIQRSFEAINKIFDVDGVWISQEYLALKYEELSLVYAYMVKEDEEREQRKAIREQMVEEEKVRREIEREKQKLEKEESQFNNEVKKLTTYLQKAKDDAERQLYIDKISDLEARLKSLEADKANVLQREQNTRAGFVYIISNIGSFGENVYKIGMTRRLEPMDRIAELSSASVPFPFDVHALIFSDDAPALENILHQYFNKMRINRVNLKKEFFRVELDEIKKVVLENHNATVKFVDIPPAEQYRETLRLNAEQQEVEPDEIDLQMIQEAQSDSDCSCVASDAEVQAVLG